MSKKRVILITIFLIILIIIGLWISGIIPKFIAKQVAINYTKNINNRYVCICYFFAHMLVIVLKIMV